jgi:hypothetical protein
MREGKPMAVRLEASQRPQPRTCEAALLAIRSKRFAHFSIIRTYVSTIDGNNCAGNFAVFPLEAPVGTYKTQPPWEFLLSASRNSLQSYELSRLSHASNLRKEITQLLDSWLEENSAAMLARWLMEQRERPATREQCERSWAPMNARRPGKRGIRPQTPCPIIFSRIKRARSPDFALARERQCKEWAGQPNLGAFPASITASPRPRRGVR